MNAQTFARLHTAQLRSGLSIAAFCRKRGLALSSYHYWRRRFGGPAAPGGFVEVHLAEPALPVHPAASERPLTLDFRGARLSLPAGFSSTSLRQCLEVLQEALPC
jgi:hypothetical protein